MSGVEGGTARLFSKAHSGGHVEDGLEQRPMEKLSAFFRPIRFNPE